MLILSIIAKPRPRRRVIDSRQLRGAEQPRKMDLDEVMENAPAVQDEGDLDEK